MSDALAFPAASSVRGTVRVPPSKSATNRALLLAALADEEIEVRGSLESEDTNALARCLESMGASLSRSTASIRVRGPLGTDGRTRVTLDAGESGTAARFLTAIAAAVPGRYLVTGRGRLTDRPVEELVSALRALGASIESTGDGGFPLSIDGGTLRAGRVRVDASRSSQFVSALLLAGAVVHGEISVEIEGRRASAPYIAATLAVLEAFGHEVAREPLSVRRGRAARVRRYEVPGDFSSALPLLASAGVATGSVTVEGVSWPCADADALAVPLLERMGISISAGPRGLTARAAGPLRGVSAAAGDFPDAVPTLAAVAACAEHASRFDSVAHLRFKESDRIDSLVRLLRSAGGEAEAGKDCLRVTRPIARREKGGAPIVLPTARDHRIAMAAGLLALRIPRTLIESADSVAKSYPRFFRDLDSLAVRGE